MPRPGVRVRARRVAPSGAGPTAMTKKKPRYESRVEVIAGSRLPLCPRMSNLEGTPLLLSRADDSR